METPASLIPSLMPCEKEKVCKTKTEKCKEERCDEKCEDDSENIVVVTENEEDESNISVEELTRKYSLKQLREMCNTQNLSNVGNKKELADRIFRNTVDLND
tara:strand:+ start:292 stop:597 length:306 start_codon:yes stop_codon:yes gene_type:complete